MDTHTGYETVTERGEEEERQSVFARELLGL